MKKLINPDNLRDSLLKYNYFVDEEGRTVHIDNFLPLFVYKYSTSLSHWSFHIQNNCLHCENVSNFKFIFPLK